MADAGRSVSFSDRRSIFGGAGTDSRGRGGGGRGADSGGLNAIAVALLSLLIGLGTALLGEARWLAADDDNLWLTALVRADAPAPLRELEDKLIAALRAQGAAGGDTVRYEKRRDYGGNYVGAVRLWRLAADRFVPQARQADATARTLARRMIVMFAAGIVATWLLFGAVLAWRVDPALRRATLAGLALIALWFALLPMQFSLALGLDKSLAHVLPETLFTLLRPHDGLSLFGFTGRNLFAVLFLAAMLCRWSGGSRMSALLLLAATALHGSYGSMMLPFVLACDLANRRGNLRDPVYLGLLALLAAYSFGSETLWRTTLHLHPAVWVGIALALAAALVGGAFALMRLPPQPATVNRPLRDVAVLAGLWLATLPIAMLMCQFADPASVKYFWTQLHARTLGVLQPVFAIACGLWLMRGEGFSRGFKALLITLALALPLGALRGLMASDGPVSRLSAQYTQLQQRLDALPARQPLAAIGERQEELIYFAIERALSGRPSSLAGAGAAP